MNILYYIPAIGQEMGGIRQYAVALLKILAQDLNNKYFIYHNINDPEVIAVLKSNPHLTLISSNVAGKKKRNAWLSRIKPQLTRYVILFPHWQQIDKPLEKICREHQISIIHCPYQFLPKAKNTKAICTIHDVQELYFPEYFSPEDRAYRAVNFMDYIKNAVKVMVSFQHVKDDIVKYFRVPEDKINVCLLAMEELWLSRYTDDDIIPLESLGISGSFIFYPANIWPHKNHYQLLRALVLLIKSDGIADIKLVCSGHKTSYYENTLLPFIVQNELQDNVIFTGIVDEQCLYSLYKKCKGAIVPTLYEAGSFPLVESILLGVPVICSDVTSLPETIGNPEYVFNPLDVKDIAAMVKKLWTDKTYREKSVQNSIIQSAKLRNTGALENMLNLYKSIIYS